MYLYWIGEKAEENQRVRTTTFLNIFKSKTLNASGIT